MTIELHRHNIARAVTSLIKAEPWFEDFSGNLLAGIRACVEIDSLFGALIEMSLSEQELNSDVVRAVWVVRKEYPAQEPEHTHPLRALYQFVVDKHGEWQKS